MRSEEELRRRVREDEARLEAQLAVVVRLKAKGRPSEVAEMLVQAYRKFLKQSLHERAVAEGTIQRAETPDERR